MAISLTCTTCTQEGSCAFHPHGQRAALRRRNRGIWNISSRRVGGLKFLKVGVFTFMFCRSRNYRPFEPSGIPVQGRGIR